MINSAFSPIYADGEAYERFNGRWARLSGRDFIGWLRIATDSHWLDVGCANGALCEVILERYAPREYVGVDIAEAQLSYAAARHRHIKVRFQGEDVLALSFQDNVFDAAVTAYAINFLPEPREMAHEMKRVVRPNGVVAACVWDFAGNRAVAQHIIAAIARRNPTFLKVGAAAKHVDSTRCEMMEKIFLDVGLRHVITTSIHTLIGFRDFEDYWVSNAELNPNFVDFMRELSINDPEELKAEVKQLVPISADGSIQYDVRSIAVKGIA